MSQYNGILSLEAFSILIVLVKGPCHGYGILQDPIIKMAPTTLYRNLKMLVREKMIVRSSPKNEFLATEKITYKITQYGTHELERHTSFLETLVFEARMRLE